MDKSQVHQFELALGELTSARQWPSEALLALRSAIMAGPDEDLYRINPYVFAERHGLDGRVAIDLLLHATRAGLLAMDWGLVCRGCGELVESHQRLAELTDHFFCMACAKTRTANLDEQVEVTFTVDPSIRGIRFHSPEALEPEDRFYRRRFSRSIRVRDDGRLLVDYIRDHAVVATDLEPGGEVSVELQARAGWFVGSPRVMITVAGEPTTEMQTVRLVYELDEWLPRAAVRPGPLRVEMINRSSERLPTLLYHTPMVTYFDYDPFLSGHQLLNDATFRRYLRTEVVRPGIGMPVGDNTLLFTDLRGSSELYDRLGDDAAFRIVSQHFECLARVVTRWSGVVVKTMGDAIMASFTRPVDAVCAAIGMLEELESLPTTALGARLEPKIGIHRGPCIAVNVADAVDYFGHSVNVAARVQTQAGGGEICLSDAVFGAAGVKDALTGRSHRESHVKLRGIEELFAVYHV